MILTIDLFLSSGRFLVLIGTGDENRIVYSCNTERLSRETPRSQLDIIKSRGHLPNDGMFSKNDYRYLNRVKIIFCYNKLLSSQNQQLKSTKNRFRKSLECSKSLANPLDTYMVLSRSDSRISRLLVIGPNIGGLNKKNMKNCFRKISKIEK